METISFTCGSCNKSLKVGADKAGLKTKCPKCGEPLVVPKPKPSEKPAAPVPEKAAVDDLDDDGSAYALSGDFDTPAATDDKDKKKKEDKPKDKKTAFVKRKIKKKSVQFAEQWLKVKVALVMVFIGMCAWGLGWLLHMLVFAMGLFEEAHYAPIVLQATQGGKMNVAAFAIGLIAGLDHMDLGKTLFLVEQVLNLAASGAFIAAYFICLAAPNNYGTRGQLIALLCLGATNVLLTLVLRLLPLVGAMYTMVPLVAPEIAMSEAGIERSLPLHAFWTSSPFWEIYGAILIQFLFFFEPILFCVFLRAVGMSLKDDEFLQPQALGLMRLGFGQYFILLGYYSLSMTGTSEVLHIVLLVAYTLWRFFLLGYIINLALLMLRARNRMTDLLEDEDEEDE